MPPGPPDRTSPGHHSALILRVRHPDGRSDEFYLAGGLTIGRSEANTIVLGGDDAVDRAHARVEIAEDGTARLRCVGPDGRLALGLEEVSDLALGPGVRFRIGRSEFECVAGHRGAAEHRVPGVPTCPFCESADVSTAGDGARPCPSCNNPLLPVRPDPQGPGPILLPAAYGGYRALAQVGRGGMGLVFKGADERGRPVAIKVLLPGTLGDRREAESFDREAEMLARVRHPNVVGLLGHGKAGRVDYLAMEWIEGPSLRKVIADARREGRLTRFPAASRWFEQAARGLAAIHAVGVVHRDIKPSNILIGPDWTARVADLGIARRVDPDRTSYTATGSVPGTFEYMAPEQVDSPDAVDGRADLYALGVTFHELLTGSRPVGNWQPASETNPTVPPAFDEILGRLLAPNAEHRPGDIRELLAMISATRQTPSTELKQATPGEEPGHSWAGPWPWSSGWEIPVDLFRGWVGSIASASDRSATAAGLVYAKFCDGVDRGATLFAKFGAIVGIPIGLCYAATGRDVSRLFVIFPLVAGFSIIGGFVGGVQGVASGLIDPGAITSGPSGTRTLPSWSPSRFRSRWPAWRGRSDEKGEEPPDVKPFVAMDVPPVGNAGSQILGDASLTPPTGDLPGSCSPIPGSAPPIEIDLHPLRGDLRPWRLAMDDGGMTLSGPLGGVRSRFTLPEAQEFLSFPGLWPGPDVLAITRRGEKRVEFRSDRSTIRAIKDHLKWAPARQGPEAIHALRARARRHVLLGTIMAGVGVFRLAQVRTTAGAIPPGLFYSFDRGLIYSGILEIIRGCWLALNACGMQRRRDAFLGISAPQVRPATRTRSRPITIPGGELGLWSPWLIGAGLLFLGPLWAGLMSGLNWYKLGRRARCVATIALGTAGMIGVVGHQIAPLSDYASLFFLAGYPGLVLFVLVPQQGYFRAYRAAGGRSGGAALPLLLIPVGAVPIVWSLLYAAGGPIAGPLDRAGSHLRAGELDLAILDCDEILRSDPSSADAFGYRALALARKGQLDRALSDCDRAIELGPGLSLPFKVRAMVHLRRGAYGQAIAACTRAIELDPGDAWAYSSRGASHLREQDAGPALADFDRAIQIDPTLAEAYVGRAFLHLSQGEIDDAISDCDRAIELDPRSAQAFLWRGSSQDRRGRHELAVADLTRSVALDPSQALAFNNRAMAYMARGEGDRSLADLNEAVRLDPTLAVSYSNRARAHLLKGEPDLARDDCNLALRLGPEGHAAFLWRGIASNALGEYEQAISDLGRAIGHGAALVLAYNARGFAYLKTSAHDRAILDYDVAIRLDPSDPDSFANRGLARRAKGELDAAAADFRSALLLNPPEATQYRKWLDEAESAKRQGGR